MEKDLIRLAFKQGGLFATVRAFCDVLDEIAHDRQDNTQRAEIKKMSKEMWELFFGYLGRIGW